MRKNSLFTLLLVSCCMMHISTYAQKDIAVVEKTGVMSLGSRNGFAVTIDNMNAKEASKALKSWISEQQKKVVIDDVSKTEIMVDNIVIPAISENPIDVYYTIAENKGSVTITGYFDMGIGFLSSLSQPVKYKEGENYIRKFAYRIEKNKIIENLNTAQKELSKQQDAEKDLEKENTSLNDDIKTYTDKIAKAKADLEQNAKDQEAKRNEIATQQKTVDSISTDLKLYDPY